eukprot:TRINITY_DN17447_c0_g1_i1.p1 TRINITY_DN17447_c0_g1~~TRINITY_DN17447_c0_g1_i1.p1  ORF type:complete len:782 (+),score=149.30 TRINITY_DN17447_c0_g1_i1:54-2399(+)
MNEYQLPPREESGNMGPSSPTPFLKPGRDLGAWFKELVPEGSPANGAVGMLGKNFRLTRQQKRNNTISFGLAATAIATVIINTLIGSIVLDVFLTFLTMCHLAAIIDLYLIWYKKETLLKPDYTVAYPSFFISPLCRYMIVHMLVTVIHAPPYVADFDDGKMRSYLNSVVLLRSFEALQTISHYTFVSSAGATLVAALTGEQLGPLFVYKMLLFKYPILTMASTAFGGFMMLSCATWFIEGASEDWGMDRAMWFTIVTFTTVGYGDHVPSSPVGRIIGVVSAIFGITASAVLVSVVQHKLALTRIQKQVILFLCEVQASRKIKAASLTVIVRAMDYNLLLNNGQPITPHRSIAGWLTTSVRARALHAKYSSLLDAVRTLKRLRSGEEGGTEWADISVLDVLQADTSDILAQNTVLQYLMRPADEGLSSQLRQTKRMTFGKKKNSLMFKPDTPPGQGSRRNTLNGEPSAEIQPMSPRMKNIIAMPGMDMLGNTRQIQQPLVRPSTPPSPTQSHTTQNAEEDDRDDDGGSVTSDETDTSMCSSQGSQRSMRTADSTKALIDLVRKNIIEMPGVPAPPPRLSKTASSRSFSIGSNLRRIRAQEASLSPKNGRCASPRKSPMSPVDQKDVASDWSANEISTGKDSLGELISEVDSEEGGGRKQQKPPPLLKRVSSERWKLAAREALRRDKLEKGTVTVLNELKVQQQVLLRRQDEQQRTLIQILQSISAISATLQKNNSNNINSSLVKVPEPAPSPPVNLPKIAESLQKEEETEDKQPGKEEADS